MEQHPVPQNVTTFEFKLIGDMTIRQFVYLAFGILVGYIFFSTNWPSLIRLPLAFFSGFSGFAFAFMPIEERPLDRWFVNFVRSVYSPTQFIWHKSPRVPEFWSRLIPTPQITTAPLPYAEMRQKLDEYLKTIPPEPKNALDQAEAARLTDLNLGETTLVSSTMPYFPLIPLITIDGIRVHRLHPVDFKKQETVFSPTEKIIGKTTSPQKPNLQSPSSTGIAGQPAIPKEGPSSFNLSIGPGGIITKAGATPIDERPAAQLTPQEAQKITKTEKQTIKAGLSQQNTELRQQIIELQQRLKTLKTEPIPETMTGKDFDIKIKELIDKIAEAEKQRLQKEKELISLRRQLSERPQENPVIKPQFEEAKETKRQPTAKYIADQTAQQKGIPTITTTPNIISGLVTTGTGEIIPGVIIVIEDKDENPVRALKTNKLGQFMTSTPLEIGTYQIELEKEGFTFDIIEVELNGGVLPPLEIKAK